MGRVIVGVILLSTGGVLGLCLAVVGVGLVLSSPVPRVIGAPPSALATAEAVEIPSASGSVLHGWWVAGAGPGSGAVVLLHGVRGNRLQMVARARVLSEHGFGALLIDMQAHGESPGRRITFGKLEALDAAAAVRFVQDRAPGARIGAIGTSLGGDALVLGAEPLPIDALVLESVYPDIAAALTNRLRVGLGPLAGPVFTPVLTSLFQKLMPPLLNVQPDDLRPVDQVWKQQAPIMIASGTEDNRTPLSEAQDLFAHAREPKQFWAVNGAGHVDLEQYDPEQYWSVVLPFLTRELRQMPRP